ncbi:hypothetical protein V8E54_006580 [Elaphomyces granulatus]
MSESSPDVQREDEEEMEYSFFSEEFEAIVLANSSMNSSPAVDLSDINWEDYPPYQLPSKPSWSDWPSVARRIEVDQGTVYTVDPKKLAITLPIGDQNPPADPLSDPSSRSDLAADPSAAGLSAAADGPEEAARRTRMVSGVSRNARAILGRTIDENSEDKERRKKEKKKENKKHWRSKNRGNNN